MHLPFPQQLIKQFKAHKSKQLTQANALFRAGERVTSLYILESGEIHLVRPLSHGNSLTIHRVLPGMIIAEASLFAAHYHCDAIAKSDSQLISCDRQQVLKLLHSQPEFAESMCVYLAGHIHELRTKVKLSHILAADERLLTWLRLHADHHTQTVTLDQPLKNIASELGVAHETLYRSLKRLEQQQLIRRDLTQITLTR